MNILKFAAFTVLFSVDNLMLLLSTKVIDRPSLMPKIALLPT